MATFLERRLPHSGERLRSTGKDRGSAAACTRLYWFGWPLQSRTAHRPRGTVADAGKRTRQRESARGACENVVK